MIPYVKHFDYRLSKAHDIHGYCHGIGKGKDETNGASKLWPQASGDQIVCPTWKADAINVVTCNSYVLIFMTYKTSGC